MDQVFSIYTDQMMLRSARKKKKKKRKQKKQNNSKRLQSCSEKKLSWVRQAKMLFFCNRYKTLVRDMS